MLSLTQCHRLEYLVMIALRSSDPNFMRNSEHRGKDTPRWRQPAYTIFPNCNYCESFSSFEKFATIAPLPVVMLQE